MGLLVFSLRFFGLDLVDLDAIFGMGEAEIDRECVTIVDVFTFRILTEYAVAGAGQGLQSSLKFNIVYCPLAMFINGQKAGWNNDIPRPDAVLRSKYDIVSLLLNEIKMTA